MGFVPRGALQPKAEAEIFAAAPGALVGPMPVAAGFALFRVDERRPAQAAILTEVKEDIRRAILVEKISKEWPSYLQSLRDKADVQTQTS